MFVLDELDKILNDLATKLRKNKKSSAMRLSLADIERINVEELDLYRKVYYRQSDLVDSKDIQANLLPKHYQSVIEANSSKKTVSSDALLIESMAPLVLLKLAGQGEQHYPFMRLIVCDSSSFEILLKLSRLTSKLDRKLNNFLFKKPFNVTAVISLPDLVDLFDRDGEPILLRTLDTVRRMTVTTFNYPLLRRVFPYIKITELIIILESKGQLDLNRFSTVVERDLMILQFLKHFAKKTILIELNDIIRSTGLPHLMYDNVLAVGPPDNNIKLTFDQKLSLTHLTSMAEKLLNLSDRLRLNVKSVAYRIHDSHGQTKVLAQFISSLLLNKKKILHSQSNLSDGGSMKPAPDRPTKILILDRMFDIQSPLFHSDMYGPFLEQEKHQLQRLTSKSIRPSVESVDILEEKLQIIQLTKVLETIMEFSLSSKTSQQQQEQQERFKIAKSSRKQKIIQPSNLAISQSLKRHLDLIKSIYGCLQDGYLMLLKLEASLASIDRQLNNKEDEVKNPAAISAQLERVYEVFRKLIKLSLNGISKSIGGYDLFRVACIILDVANRLSFHHRRANKDQDGNPPVALEIVSSLLNDRDLRKTLKSINTNESNQIDLVQKLNEFHRLSASSCGSRCNLSPEQLISRLARDKLPDDQFNIKLLDKQQSKEDAATCNATLVVIFLGSMSPFELCKFKLAEASILGEKSRLILLNCGQIRPEEFLMALKSSAS